MKINSFTASLKLTLRGKRTVKFFTVLLSAFSFTLFSLASMAYTYNEDDHLLRAYRYYLENTYPYVNFSKETEGEEWASEEVALIREKTELPYACLYDERNGALNAFSDYRPDVQDAQLEEYNALTAKINNLVFVGDEELSRQFGFKTVAGRFPQNVHEIAISEEQFALFHYLGFRDVTDHFEFNGYVWSSDRLAAPIEPVRERSDLLGKKIVLYGNLESGERTKGSIYETEIVGIVQTNGRISRPDRPYPDGSLFLSREWEEIFHGGHDACAYMISPELPDDARLRKCISLTKDFVEEYVRQNPEANSRVPEIGLVDMDKLLETKDVNGPNYFFSGGKSAEALVLGAAGGFFCIFAIILTGYLMTAMMDAKRRQIGILRALGASRRRVSGYFLIGTLVLSGIIFLVSLAMSLTIYYAWIVPIASNEWFGASQFVYNGWTVLILAGISFIVPVLSVLLPLKLFMRRTCAEMIKGAKQKETGKELRSK